MLDLDVHLLFRPSPAERRSIETFLNGQGLSFEGDPDLTVAVEDGDGRVVATGSLEGKVIKMVAVDGSRQDGGLSSVVISRLLQVAREEGKTHLFVYTKPDAAERFLSLGFIELARVASSVVLLEMGEPGVATFRAYLASIRKESVGRVGAIVVNANPFTRGHRYLIEEARRRCDHLYVIVVETDLSLFPFADRIDLIRRGTEDLEGVTVLRSGDYAVSRATFPSYFLRGTGDEERALLQTRLDVTLFANLFVPALAIGARFVGTEPYCPVTRRYNEAMREILPSRSVDFIEIPRLEWVEGTAVSASSVRDAIRADDWDLVRRLVPPVTWDYLRSPQAEAVLERIRLSDSRH